MQGERDPPGGARAHNASEGAGISVYLHPGQLYASAQPATITTILGSCVGVVLWDPDTHVGGMNHFVLPLGSQLDPSPRFGNFAMPQLLTRVTNLGANRRRLEAKVFGGACVMQAFRTTQHLGMRNIETALAFLKVERIPVVGQDTGGNRGRKLILSLETGQTLMRLI